MTKGVAIKYSEAELIWIKCNRELPHREAHIDFCKKFNRDDVSLVNYKSKCQRSGWRTGRTGCYEKGREPENKGQKMLFNANSARTQFKKGNQPHNTNYIGHERITKNGYIEINIGAKKLEYRKNYVLKHKYLWEQENGKLEAGDALKCLDGNKQNFEPSNWEVISRGVLPFLNGRYNGNNYDHMPAEIKPAVLTLAKVKYAKSKIIKAK